MPRSVLIVSSCPSVRPSVCLSVRRPTGHSFWPRNLIFWHSNPWDDSKKWVFCFFEILIWGPLRGPQIFFGEYFPLYLCIDFCLFCFLPTGHSFWPRNLIFWHSNPWDMSQKRIFFFRNFDFWPFEGPPKGHFRVFSSLSFVFLSVFFVTNLQVTVFDLGT